MPNFEIFKADMKENLPFYLNDFDEQSVNFIVLRLIGNLSYKNIISADFSQTEQQLKDQFEKISNDLQDYSFMIKSSNLLLSKKDNKNKIIEQKAKNCSDIYKNFHKKEYDTENKNAKLILTVNSFYLLKTVFFF